MACDSVRKITLQADTAKVELWAWCNASAGIRAGCCDRILNRHRFARHLSAIEIGNQRGIHEQQALSLRIQA